MKKFIIRCYTNWCGEDNSFAAIADSEFNKDLGYVVDSYAYENFSSFDGFAAILEELFPDVDDYTEEMEEAACAVEGNYYGASIEEVDSDDLLDEWNELELIFDQNAQV